MDEAITFGAFCFVSLFVMVDPIGTLPIFLGMTAHMPPEQQHSVARRAALISFLILLAIAFAGQAVFRFFGITIHELKVVGGIIIFLVGYDMLHARLSQTTHDEASARDTAHDIALTPLGIPMLCGPGAIANTMVLWDQAGDWKGRVILLAALAIVNLATLAILLGGRRLSRFIGDSGNKVLLRLMGLITMVIAVDFFFAGLKPIVRDILGIADK